MKPIYTAPSAEAAAAELDALEAGAWWQKFPTVVATWRRAWDRVIPFFAFSPAVRLVIYTTNAIESPHTRLRKIIKTRGHFPSDDAATKVIWLVLRNITGDWGRAAKEWKEAMHQFAMAYGERFTRPAAQYAARLLLNRWTLHGASNREIQTAPLPGCANTVIGDLMIKVLRQAHEERSCRAIQQDLLHLSPRLLVFE